jgi:hypothetical protein
LLGCSGDRLDRNRDHLLRRRGSRGRTADDGSCGACSGDVGRVGARQTAGRAGRAGFAGAGVPERVEAGAVYTAPLIVSRDSLPRSARGRGVINEADPPMWYVGPLL